MAVKPIPAGYHTATPYLMVDGAAEAIEFYRNAFGATELFRMPTPDGKVAHAEIRIGDSPIMIADETADMKDSPQRSPRALSGTSVSLMLYVEDVDARFEQATAAGAKALRPVQDQFYGDRAGTLRDPYGHVWTLATHVEDVAPDEMNRRAKAMYGG